MTRLDAPAETPPTAPDDPGAIAPGRTDLETQARREMLMRRLGAAGFAAGGLAVLVLAAFLQPSGQGLGTHTSIGLSECGWITYFETPCPTCGMTTAFAHAADGRFLDSFLTQPAGFVLALATAVGVLLALYVALTGSRVVVMLKGFWTRRATWAAVVFALAAWLYKIADYKDWIG